MKFHLPKKLMVAVLAAMVADAYAVGPLQAQVRYVVAEGKTHSADMVLKFSNNSQWEASTNDNPQAWVKDGPGTATLSSDLTVYQPIVVREGTLTMTDCEIKNYNNLGSGVANLNVGGKDAHLKLDDATYIQDLDYSGNSSSSIAIGTGDGAGKLTLENGSLLHSDHFIFAGERGTTYDGQPAHVLSTTKSCDDKSLYESQHPEGETLRSEINVLSGSKLSAGTCLQFSNVDVNVDGDGSELIDWNRDSTTADKEYSYFGSSDDDETNVKVTNGGKVTIQQSLMTGVGKGSTTHITVDGVGSALNIESHAMLGYYGAYDYKNGAYVTGNTTTHITLTNGATATFGTVYAGWYDKATISLDAESSLTTGYLWVGPGSTLSVEAGSSTAPITIFGSWDMAEGAIMELDLSAEFLKKLDADTSDGSFKVAIATAEEGANVSYSTLNWTNEVWSLVGELDWEQEGTTTYIKGTLKRNESVDVEDGGVVDSDVTDTDETKVSMTLTGETTISGDNSHTGGTTLDNAQVKLDSVNALGEGAVKVKAGSSNTMTTGEVVVANLAAAIQNDGELSMSGSYQDSGNKLITKEIDATHLSAANNEGKNGFKREGGTQVIAVVENSSGAVLKVAAGTTLTSGGEKYAISNSGNALAVDYSTYHINENSHQVTLSSINDVADLFNATPGSVTVDMKAGELTVDALGAKINATGGTIITLGGDMTVGGQDSTISGTTSMAVLGGTTTLEGDNSHSGTTQISGQGTELKVGAEKALGNSTVLLENQATLNLNGHAVKNRIIVTGCELVDAYAYDGDLEVSGDLTIRNTDPTRSTTAGTLTLQGSGNVAPASTETLAVDTIVVAADAAHDDQIKADTTVKKGLVLNSGAELSMSGALTMEAGSTVTLNGSGYHANQEIVSADGGLEADGVVVTMSRGMVRYAVSANTITLLAVFDQNIADAMVQGNWGMATGSRSFVDTVRGQRNNTGCIANGRGTAWASVLGAYADMDGGEVSLKGAAVGADMKVGERSVLGLALGYLDGEVTPAGLRDVDQSSTYIAAYGEHGLKKLSATTCLSLDWVAALGRTKSEFGTLDWTQNSMQLNSRVSWNKLLSERMRLSVFGGLEYFATGSDTVEGIKTGSVQNLRGEIGMGAQYVAMGAAQPGGEKLGVVPRCKRLVLNGEVSVFNDLMRDNPEVTMDGMSNGGVNPGRTGFGVGVGATYTFNERWSASANYSVNAMKDSTEHRVNIGASYTF